MENCLIANLSCLELIRWHAVGKWARHIKICLMMEYRFFSPLFASGQEKIRRMPDDSIQCNEFATNKMQPKLTSCKLLCNVRYHRPQGLCSCLFKSCDRGGRSYKHSPNTQGKKTMENFQFSSAHNIILKATSLTNYHYYLRLACIDWYFQVQLWLLAC